MKTNFFKTDSEKQTRDLVSMNDKEMENIAGGRGTIEVIRNEKGEYILVIRKS